MYKEVFFMQTSLPTHAAQKKTEPQVKNETMETQKSFWNCQQKFPS